MSHRLSRRALARMSAGALAASALGFSILDARAETRLRMIWWGNPDRDKRTFAALEAYTKAKPEVATAAESVGWGDYWPKLATQAAGRNLPDVVQMDYRYIFEYARRAQLADLTPFIGKQINLSSFDKALLETGKVDGKLFGIPMGGNSTGIVYNKTKLDALGIKMPDPVKWTYDDLRALGKEVAERTNKGIAAVANMGWLEQWLEVWVRQRGKALYTAEGKLGFDVDDVASFWSFWDDMQKAGYTPAPDVQALDDRNLDKKMVVLGKALIDFSNSNQLLGTQKLINDELALTMIPGQKGGKPGQYLKPSMLLSMAATGAQRDAAAELVGYMTTSPEAANILEVERGVPGDLKIREQLAARLQKTDKDQIDYMTLCSTNVSPIPPPPPKGAGEIENLLLRSHQQVAFGKVGISDGAKEFVKQCDTILRRA